MTIINGQDSPALIHRALIVSVCLTFLAFSFGTALLTICSLSALAAWLVSQACSKSRQEWLRQEWTIPVLLLTVLPWVAILWSSSYVNTVSHAQRSHYWLFSFVALSAITSEQILRRVIVLFLWGIAISSTIILLYSFSILPSPYFMTGTIEAGYITYSLLVVVAIILLAFFYPTLSKPLHKAALAGLIILLVLTITHLSGRSGYLALLLLSPWMFFTMFGRRRFITVLVALGVIFTLMFTSQQVRKRIALIPKQIKLYQTGESPDTSVGLRIGMWQTAWNVFISNPVAGTGTAGLWHETNKARPGHGLNHPHNSYLYVAANYGIIGLLLYAWLLVITVKRAWRARHRLSGYSILAFLSVILIGSLTDTQILSAATGIALGFVTGIPTDPESTCASSS